MSLNLCGDIQTYVEPDHESCVSIFCVIHENMYLWLDQHGPQIWVHSIYMF